LYRKDRKRSRGGGLILYIKNNIRAGVNEKFTNEEFAESIWCNVELNEQRLLVGLCYRSPTSTDINDEKLRSVIEKAILRATTYHLLIMGDFNYPQIDYASENVAAKPTDQPTLKHLYQHVRDATRIRQNRTPTTLDYVFTEEENLIELINYEAPLGTSDHVVLAWKLLLATPTISSSQVKFNFHKGEYESMRNSLRLIDWKE